MTPKQKAEDLLHKYMILEDNENNFNYDIKCAIIAVDEILKLQLIDGYDHEFWKEVKQELEEKIEL